MKSTFRSILRLLVTLGFVGGWTLAAAALHVVWTPDMLPTLVTKDRLGFSNTWADTRTWTLEDAAAHPALVKRLLEAGRLDTLDHIEKFDEDTAEDLAAEAPAPSSVNEEIQGLLGPLLEKLRNATDSSEAPEVEPTES